MGNMSGYEIRQQILVEARQHLMDEFFHEVAVEESVALKEGRTMKTVTTPTPEEIIALAEKLYAFVKKTD
jgi:hypothetical protein